MLPCHTASAPIGILAPRPASPFCPYRSPSTRFAGTIGTWEGKRTASDRGSSNSSPRAFTVSRPTTRSRKRWPSCRRSTARHSADVRSGEGRVLPVCLVCFHVRRCVARSRIGCRIVVAPPDPLFMVRRLRRPYENRLTRSASPLTTSTVPMSSAEVSSDVACGVAS